MSLPIPSIDTRDSPKSPMALNAKDQEAIDNILVALATRSGGDLRMLLYSFFSFLHRRTDFYIVPHEDDNATKMGFREGDAEKVLLAAFRQFPLRKMPRRADMETTAGAQQNKDMKTKREDTGDKGTEKEDANKTKSEKLATKETSSVRLTEEGLQVPVGNGGSTERYKWTQTLEECSVMIKVPENVRAKELDVKIVSSALSVKLKKPLDDGKDVFLEGELAEKVDPGESTWSLEGGVLIVVLYKRQKMFWDTIISGDSKIDTSLVDSRRHVSEYDSATQAQIRKMIFDENQVRKGQPTSDELTGTKPPIPPLPPGVEYINQEKIDKALPRNNK